MKSEVKKHVDKMSKSELKIELENLRLEYEDIVLKEEIIKMIKRIPASDALFKIKDYVEKVYKENVAGGWGFMHGVHGNIVDMADNLLEMRNYEQLQYFNCFMYSMLQNREPEATEGLYTMTPGMQKSLIKRLTEEKGA